MPTPYTIPADDPYLAEDPSAGVVRQPKQQPQGTFAALSTGIQHPDAYMGSWTRAKAAGMSDYDAGKVASSAMSRRVAVTGNLANLAAAQATQDFADKQSQPEPQAPTTTVGDEQPTTFASLAKPVDPEVAKIRAGNTARRAIEARGLTQLLTGDWNDQLNREGFAANLANQTNTTNATVAHQKALAGESDSRKGLNNQKADTLQQRTYLDNLMSEEERRAAMERDSIKAKSPEKVAELNSQGKVDAAAQTAIGAVDSAARKAEGEAAKVGGTAIQKQLSDAQRQLRQYKIAMQAWHDTATIDPNEPNKDKLWAARAKRAQSLSAPLMQPATPDATESPTQAAQAAQALAKEYSAAPLDRKIEIAKQLLQQGYTQDQVRKLVGS